MLKIFEGPGMDPVYQKFEFLLMPQDAQPFILIVDDCDSTRESLVAAFDAKGLLSKGAIDGEAALELVKDGPCAAIALVAYHLHNANGAETIRCLKLLCPKMRIIAMSIEHSRRGEMIEAGATEFFEKPFDLPALLTSVTSPLSVIHV
jgi:DNA-binding NtrC family response regulator